MLIKDVINETTAGGIASVAMPMGSMIKRPNPSIYSKTKVKKKVTKRETRMNVFIHVTCAAGFDVLKAKIEKDMAGPAGEWLVNTVWLILATMNLCLRQM